ncbi:hypothetical protein FDP41_003134 [Naegleria fowleri]|uniref:choline-phosphate cytidylyltransferase n=1 Tax=Naegleria fowleri TaxID=5763 RepID=A0A6A5BSV7_NAEFO|nr:uncharacterized protein FDP41_003134 [Naegleria fowleri]KAF0977812.1 hypothetical protein FDP41_003134 [Naegleria fowleri]CAG4712428.1 unnamed protein product [Naegleria fowleri]
MKRTFDESGVGSNSNVEDDDQLNHHQNNIEPNNKKVKQMAMDIDFSKYKEGDIITESDGRYEFRMLQGKLCRVPLDRPVRVYADGIYDLFHFGHMRSLQQAKNLFPNTQLIVGVCSDADTWRIKGKTVLTEDERYEGVSHCRYVDEVVPAAPWVVTPEFVVEHNIDFVSHGEDLSVDENGNDVYEGLKKMHRFLTIKRTEGISTSDIIMRIIKERDSYIERNLKRGYTPDQLGIGLVGKTVHGVKQLIGGIVNVFSPRKAKAESKITEEQNKEETEATEPAEGGIFDDEEANSTEQAGGDQTEEKEQIESSEH